MYIVSPDGTVADAFPGVYVPGDVLPSMEAAVIAATRPQDDQLAYHLERTSAAVQARINLSKAFVESSLLDATGTGARFEVATPAGVIDLSHVASDRDETRKRLGIPASLTEEEAME